MLSDHVPKVHCLFRLIVAEPLEEKGLFWKGYFDLDFKHASHHAKAFKARADRFSDVSLSDVSPPTPPQEWESGEFFKVMQTPNTFCNSPNHPLPPAYMRLFKH